MATTEVCPLCNGTGEREVMEFTKRMVINSCSACKGRGRIGCSDCDELMKLAANADIQVMEFAPPRWFQEEM